MRTQFGPIFTPVWLFNSLIVRVWDEVKCFFNPKKVQIRIGGWSHPFFNVLGGCGCDSREICAGDLWWFSAFEPCLIQVARTWIHPVSMASTYPVEKGLAVGKRMEGALNFLQNFAWNVAFQRLFMLFMRESKRWIGGFSILYNLGCLPKMHPTTHRCLLIFTLQTSFRRRNQLSPGPARLAELVATGCANSRVHLHCWWSVKDIMCYPPKPSQYLYNHEGSNLS